MSPTVLHKSLFSSSQEDLSVKDKMSLCSLPRDVLRDIGQHLSPADLVALSLVNKEVRDLAQSLLYASIHVT